MENVWNKIFSTGCKWSNSSAPRSETPVSHQLLGESIFPFPAPAPSFLPLSGVIRNGSPQYKGQEGGIFLKQNQLTRIQMGQFECLLESFTFWAHTKCISRRTTYAPREWYFPIARRGESAMRSANCEQPVPKLRLLSLPLWLQDHFCASEAWAVPTIPA